MRATLAGFGTAAMLAAAVLCALAIGTALLALDGDGTGPLPGGDGAALDGTRAPSDAEALEIAAADAAAGVVDPTAASSAGPGGAPPGAGPGGAASPAGPSGGDDDPAPTPPGDEPPAGAPPAAGPASGTDTPDPPGPLRRTGDAVARLGRDAGGVVGGPLGSAVGELGDTLGDTIGDVEDGFRRSLPAPLPGS